MTQKKETKKLEILVVEDDPRHITMADTLREEGHSVNLATDYRSAVEALGQKHYDVVLTDLFFPLNATYGDDVVFDEEACKKPEALGYPLAMIALTTGVRYVGIVTMGINHHDGVFAATTDQVGFNAYTQRGYYRSTKVIGEEKGLVLRVFNTGEGGAGSKNPYQDCGGKNWKACLDVLLTGQLPQGEVEMDQQEYRERLAPRY